ncbi:ATP-binding protein, partial [Enterococcus faecium]
HNAKHCAFDEVELLHKIVDLTENGQCLMQDLYGRVGVVQVHPVFEELFHAFDTRPPVQERME